MSAAALEPFSEDGEMNTGEARFQPFVHDHGVDPAGDEASGICYPDLRTAQEGRSQGRMKR
jgi:hypothetical protein